MKAENIGNNGYSQRDSAEHEGYVKARRLSNRIWKERDSAEPKLLEKILDKNNLSRAYKRVKANKGAPGINGKTIKEIYLYLREHQKELLARIYRGKYTPSLVRRVEIQKKMLEKARNPYRSKSNPTTSNGTTTGTAL